VITQPRFQIYRGPGTHEDFHPRVTFSLGSAELRITGPCSGGHLPAGLDACDETLEILLQGR